jgi:hypothetical protein
MLNTAMLTFSADAAAKTRSSLGFEINDLQSSISAAHPGAAA